MRLIRVLKYINQLFFNNRFWFL